jgi:hypothetical protein
MFILGCIRLQNDYIGHAHIWYYLFDHIIFGVECWPHLLQPNNVGMIWVGP